jgi:outer membrane biosynthesis protein TonB
MSRDKRFWRNVTLIALLHVALLSAVLRWSTLSNKAEAQSITWLSTALAETADSSALAAAQKESESSSEPTPVVKDPPERAESEPIPAVKSDIELPSVAPTVTPKPTPRPAPQPTRKPVPKSSPNKNSPAKAKKAPLKKSDSDVTRLADAATRKKTAKETQAKKGAGASVSAKSGEKSANRFAKASNDAAGGRVAGPAANASDFGWYGNMLHDRFYKEWVQPTTVVASGAKFSALAKIRIEKDGGISDFKIVRSSGNVVVDESIEAVAKRVTRVDSLPSGLANGDHYDVNINFELNPEE